MTNKDVDEDGFHTGVTGPPVSKEDVSDRHEGPTTPPQSLREMIQVIEEDVLMREDLGAGRRKARTAAKDTPGERG